MSHIVTIKTELKNFDTIKEVCKRLGLHCKQSNDINVYNTNKTGMGIHLKGWKYPIVVNKQGVVYYDNYNGNWGNMKEYNKFVDEYSLEETLKKIKKKNLKYNIQRINNEIKIEVMI